MTTKTLSARIASALTIFALTIGVLSPIFALPQTAFAADSGFLSPTSLGSTSEWTSPTNVYGSDDVWALGRDGSSTDDQGYDVFNLGVPTGATINGIEVKIEAKGEKANDCKINVKIANNTGSQVKSATITSTSDQTYTFGGASDLWSDTWNSTHFSNANFILELEVADVSSSGGGSCANDGSEDVLVDHVQVKVHYTEGAPDPIEGQNLAITCDAVDISGTTYTISGTWKAYNFPGNASQYDVAAFSPLGVVADTSTKDSPDAFVTTQGPSNFVGTNPNKADMEGTWSNVLTFGSAPSYLAASLYHAGVPGNEQSGDSTCTFVLPQCSNGIDDDSDGDTDYPADPGCATAEDNDESDDPSTLGGLVVNKVLVNDNGGTTATTSFSFTIPGVNAGNPIAFEADGSNEFTLDAGAYNVTEVANAAYTTSYSGCSATVTAGATTTCTITNNDKPGTLSVKKILPNDNGGTATASQFSFSVNNGPATAFESDGQNDLTVNAGTYTVVETNPMTGYTVSYSNCENVAVGNGETKTCTITNDDQQASLTVTKVVNNVRESTTYGVGDFSLLVGVESVVSGIAEFFNAGTFTISESGPLTIGYNAVFTGDCDTNGSITLANGATKTCTITNTEKTPGTLLVKKVVINNEPEGYTGTAGEGDFTLSVSGGNPAPSSFAGSTDGTSVTIDAGASYSVSETGGPTSSYGATYSADCFGTMPEGGSKTCTVTNNDNPPTTGGLTIVKVLPNDNGGTAEVISWTYKVGETQVTAGQNTQFAGGTYTVSETGGPSGYAVSFSGDCTDNGDGTASVTVVNGQSKTCTITNDDIAPTLKLVKQVTIENGGTKTPADWTLAATGGEDGFSDLGNSETFHTVTAGVTYELSESVVAGYSSQGWSCDADVLEGNEVVLALDQDVTCTVTNVDLPGTLHVKKVLINDNGGTMATSSFQFQINDGEPINFESDGQNDISLPAGTYDVTELLAEGYGATYDNCENIVIENGGEATCTITNDDGKAMLTIEKHAYGADGSFTFEVTGQDPVVIETEEGSGSTNVALDAGTYDVVELVPEGWSLSSSYCVYDEEGEVGESIENGETVTLGVGDQVTCKFYNYATGADLSVTKSVNDTSVEVGQTIEYTLTASNAGPAEAHNVVVTDVLPLGVTYVSDDGAGSYATSTGAWSVGTLASGASKSLVITVTVNSGSDGLVIINSASIGLDDEVSDYNENNDAASASVTLAVAPQNGQCNDGIDNEGDTLIDQQDPQCFTNGVYNPTNTEASTPPTGGGGGITGLGGGGAVLGASTVGEVLGTSCGLYMDKYVRQGKKNNVEQVKKLQEFLNKYMNSGLPITGFYGPLSTAAVQAFQAKHADTILTPWGIATPTGIVYRTTLRQINMIECPDLAAALPELVEWSKANDPKKPE